MAKAYMSGRTGESTMENTTWIKNMGLVHIHGQMVEAMKAAGRTGNNMVKVSIIYKMEQLKLENGSMAKEHAG